MSGDRNSDPPPAGRAILRLRGDGLANLVHVERFDLADEVVQSGAPQGARLLEDENVVAERNQRRNRSDAERAGKSALGFGVDLSEGDVRKAFGGLLEHRGELAARAAPGSPEVEQRNSFLDGLLDIGLSDFDGCHWFAAFLVVVLV